MCVIALDPGNSTGWCVRAPGCNKLFGGTIGTCHKDVFELLNTINPDVVVYETFQMYPNKAQKLLWNSFYPCEVIGVIKLWAMLHPDVKLVGLQPSVKKYALSVAENELWRTVDTSGEKPTEHLRDAVRLLRYYERNRT